VMDTGVNLAHDILQGARVEVLPDVLDTRSPSAAVHGTAVVSLLAGNPRSRVPGLIPEAQILAVDVFSSAGQDERADVVALLRGLDALAARDVRIVNLSLAGPANTLLESALARLRAERGMIFVAAAGNGGPEAAPAYPAAYAGVLAITAVDQRGRPYRQAQRGPHLDAAAPGVNLLAATSVRGAAAKSGTSFATPFATAALALYLSRDPAAPVEAVEQRLLSQLRDIGAAGADDIHGGGLLSLTDLCG
ncbi:MAG: S8 family serine peptidase, partial [Gemmobacter sp.]